MWKKCFATRVIDLLKIAKMTSIRPNLIKHSETRVTRIIKQGYFPIKQSPKNVATLKLL